MKESSRIEKLINGHELERHTFEGWIVIDRVFVEEAIIFLDEVAHPRAGEKNEGGGYGMHGSAFVAPTIPLHRQKVGQVIKFLVAKGFDLRLVEMEEGLQDMRKQYSDVTGENQELKQWKANAEKTYADLQEVHEKAKVRHSDAITAKRNLENRVRAMEKDIAKVRTAIGEKQMSGILSDDQSS